MDIGYMLNTRVLCLQAAVLHTPIVLGRAALRRLRPGEVLLRRWPNPCMPAQWFRLLDEDQPVVVGPCGHFFEAEEYEMVREHHE
jgi:intraflagellar transport protein 122